MAGKLIGSKLPPLLSEVIAFTLPSHASGGLKLAALEKRLRQDPTDLRRRAAAISFYSRDAMRELTHGDAASLEEPLGRAKEHLEYVLKATDDIHLLHNVLIGSLGPRLLYEVPTVSAQYMRKIGLDRECLEEFDTRSQFEERATQYHFANALTILKATGHQQEAKELYEEAIDLEWNGRKPIKWHTFDQTPGVYIENLEHRFFWEGEAQLPITAFLTENLHIVQEDLAALREKKKAAGGERFSEKLSKFIPRPQPKRVGQVPAYPALTESGVWDMVQLYVNKEWQEESCKLMPRTAELLRSRMPSTSSPYVHYNSEEIVLFLLAPGSKVRLHNGGSNAPLNIHCGLSGCEGAYMEVGGAHRRKLKDGQAICFDDGTDHSVWHDGEEERWVLTVRVLHPHLAQHPERYYSQAFTRRTCFESWSEERHKAFQP